MRKGSWGLHLVVELDGAGDGLGQGEAAGLGGDVLHLVPPDSVQCAVCSVQCAVCSAQCAVCSVQFLVWSVQSTVGSVQCLQCIVCSVRCAVCSVR